MSNTAKNSNTQDINEKFNSEFSNKFPVISETDHPEDPAFKDITSQQFALSQKDDDNSNSPLKRQSLPSTILLQKNLTFHSHILHLTITLIIWYRL